MKNGNALTHEELLNIFRSVSPSFANRSFDYSANYTVQEKKKCNKLKVNSPKVYRNALPQLTVHFKPSIMTSASRPANRQIVSTYKALTRIPIITSIAPSPIHNTSNGHPRNSLCLESMLLRTRKVYKNSIFKRESSMEVERPPLQPEHLSPLIFEAEHLPLQPERHYPVILEAGQRPPQPERLSSGILKKLERKKIEISFDNIKPNLRYAIGRKEYQRSKTGKKVYPISLQNNRWVNYRLPS